MHDLRIRSAICFLAALFTLSAAAPAADEIDLAPSAEQSKTLFKVKNRLNQFHYRQLELDDEFSEHLLDQYIEYLDPSRIYFLASDVAGFERFRLTLDDAVRKGDLGPGFEIFNRFHKRRIDRMEYLNRAVEKDFDRLRFDVAESLELDREDAPWVRSFEEWDELWRKQFKNDVLNLKLTDKPMDEIKEILAERYRNRLKRVLQINSGDVFRVFTNTFTQIYDPHTEYFPPRRAENFDISMKLSYEGIGALLNGDGEYIKIARIIPGGPAEKNGELEAGDRIVGVAQGADGETVDVIGWRVDEVVDLIRGPKDTVVRLSVIPANQPDTGSTRIVQLTRNEVKLEEQAAQRKIVEAERGGKKVKIGVIELPAFYVDFKGVRDGAPDYKSSTRDVKMHVEALKAQGVEGIVIDLRGNGGGSLPEAVDLTAIFTGAGPLVQVRDLEGKVQIFQFEDDAIYDGPLAVLVDRLSASASEIFAGAIQDLGRGIVVGGRTFGKGTVQSLAPLDGGQLKVTYAKFYRISGGSTQNRGVIPDILFPSMYDDEEIGESALDEALPWDQIDPVKFRRSVDVLSRLPELTRLHEERIAKNPDFVYLTERLDYFAEARKKTAVSLNEAVRKQERESMEKSLLAVENRRRTAKGLDPVERFEDLEDEDFDPKTEVDTFAREAVNILLDR